MLSSILVKRLVGSAPYSWVWNKRFHTGLLIFGKLSDLSLIGANSSTPRILL